MDKIVFASEQLPTGLDNRARYTLWRDLYEATYTSLEIASDSGFGDLSYFNRCFRRRFGATPNMFRGRDAADGALPASHAAR